MPDQQPADVPQPCARRYVSPLLVARALGVSETTVKRWVDETRLPAQRTAGGHRRILVDDVLTLVSRENWPHVDLGQLLGTTPQVQPADVALLREQFHQTLVNDEPERARTLFLLAHQGGLAASRLADEVVSPVMARLGHDWSTGQLDVYQEHRGTQVCLGALLALKARMDSSGAPGADQPLAIGGGPEFDHYVLANLLVELTLRELGWRVVNIGPNTPFASFHRAMREHQPRLLWLSCSYLPDVPAFLAGFRTLRDEAVSAGVEVAVGGRALTDAIVAQMTFAHHGNRMADLTAFARTIR